MNHNCYEIMVINIFFPIGLQMMLLFAGFPAWCHQFVKLLNLLCLCFCSLLLQLLEQIIFTILQNGPQIRYADAW